MALLSSYQQTLSSHLPSWVSSIIIPMSMISMLISIKLNPMNMIIMFSMAPSFPNHMMFLTDSSLLEFMNYKLSHSMPYTTAETVNSFSINNNILFINNLPAPELWTMSLHDHSTSIASLVDLMQNLNISSYHNDSSFSLNHLDALSSSHYACNFPEWNNSHYRLTHFSNSSFMSPLLDPNHGKLTQTTSFNSFFTTSPKSKSLYSNFINSSPEWKNPVFPTLSVNNPFRPFSTSDLGSPIANMNYNKDNWANLSLFN